MTETPKGTLESDRAAGSTAMAAIASALGVIACVVALIAGRNLQWNVVTYAAQPMHPPSYLVPTLFAAGLLVLLVLCALLAARRLSAGVLGSLALLWPLIGGVPLAISAAAGLSVPFAFSLLVILGCGAAAGRVGAHLPEPRPAKSGSRWALASLLLLVAVATVVHTLLQINFFEHFMLGHADFGHFTEELKNALAGRGLRSDSFPNTRLGWHFVPLLYGLVPGYALWPSPVYLMFVGALVVHLPALPVYACARRLSGSVLVGWLFGVAWLLLPSPSRLVYSNTYGFQWIYVAMPLIAAMAGAGLAGRWRSSLILAAVVLLLKETAAAATFGWGLYMLLFTPRRKSGAALAFVSVAYALLCIYVFIPHFAASGAYERMTLFGELGDSVTAVAGSLLTNPGLFFARLFRTQGLYFLLVLLAPMAMLPLGRWRVLVAALPSLGLILLLENTEWLSIKFWHQATVLPFLFLAAVATSAPVSQREGARPRFVSCIAGRRPRDGSLGLALALAAVFAAAWGQYFYGFSPVAKSFEVYADNEALHRPDPRMETVRQLRETFGRDKTVLATERLAAHFTDYARVYTGVRPMPADVVVIDRADRWDQTALSTMVQAFRSDPEYDVYGEFGSIVVFVRAPDAPPIELTD